MFVPRGHARQCWAVWAQAPGSTESARAMPAQALLHWLVWGPRPHPDVADSSAAGWAFRTVPRIPELLVMGRDLPYLHLYVTESQNGLSGKGPYKPSHSTPCPGQGPLPPAQGAPSPVQPGLEPCQGGGSHSSSGQPGPGPHHSHCRQFLP